MRRDERRDPKVKVTFRHAPNGTVIFFTHGNLIPGICACIFINIALHWHHLWNIIVVLSSDRGGLSFIPEITLIEPDTGNSVEGNITGRKERFWHLVKTFFNCTPPGNTWHNLPKTSYLKNSLWNFIICTFTSHSPERQDTTSRPQELLLLFYFFNA